MTNWATIPHQGIQGGYPLIYAGCLDGNQTHAHTDNGQTLTTRPDGLTSTTIEPYIGQDYDIAKKLMER